MKLQTLKYRIGNLVYNTLQVPRTTMKRRYEIKGKSGDKKYKKYYGKPYKDYLYNKDNSIRTRKVKSLREFKHYYYSTDKDDNPDSRNILKKAVATLLDYAKSDDTTHAEEKANNSNLPNDSGNEISDNPPKRESRQQGQGF